jgi:hypothetical protein
LESIPGLLKSLKIPFPGFSDLFLDLFSDQFHAPPTVPQLPHVVRHPEAVRHCADPILKIFAKTPEKNKLIKKYSSFQA